MVSPVAYNSTYSAPWFGGSAVADSSVVPGTYMVAVNGRPYMLNTDPQAIDAYGEFFKEESLPLLRAQADQAKTAAEQSIDPRQFWRRGQETWHGGGGQSVLDRDISDNARFNASLGINPWTRYQLTPHKQTSSIRTSAATNLYAVAASNGIYWANGTALEATTTLTGFTTITGTPGSAILDIATDGIHVFTAHNTDGIYMSNGATTSSYVTGSVSHVGFAKGRLLAAQNGALYNPVAAGALPAAHFTHPDAGWQWNAFAEGDAVIYAAGNLVANSRIYRIGVKADGSGLDAPIVAATLPTNEIVRTMRGYLGFLVIGTDKGVRFATATESGDLTLGALIPIPSAVTCLDAGDRFAWFGWSNYNATNTGLGRIDLSVIHDGLSPAYATDLMAAATQGAVQGVAQLNGRMLFTVSGVGVFAEHATNYLASASMSTGQITYGIADPKVAVKIDVKHAPLPATTGVTVSASFDRGTVTMLGSSVLASSVSPSQPISAGKRRSEEVEITLTLTSATATSAATLTRWTLMSFPAPTGASTYVLPLLLHTRLTTLRDTDSYLDPYYEYQVLTALHRDRSICTVQVGGDAFEGVMEDYVWLPNAGTWDRGWWDGTFVAKLRRIN